MLLRDRERLGEGDLQGPAATLLIPLGTCPIHKDAPHQASGHRQKVCAVLPVDVLDVDQPQVGLVDKCGGLEAVPSTFSCHAPLGDAVQLSFDQGNQPFERTLVALAPRQQQPRDRTRSG